MPAITIGTFNLNNLFSRFNYRGVVRAGAGTEPDVAIEIDFGPAAGGRLVFPDARDAEVRRYRGRLVEGKHPADTRRVAERLAEADPDVWALQEVEDLPTLQRFLAEFGLSRRYPHVVLVEGNDDRLIDVAVVSSYPLGPVTSWQHARLPVDPDGPRVFSRDLLEVDLLSRTRARRLLTLYVTHLKSKFTGARTPEEEAEETRAADERRRLQAETAVSITRARQRPGGSFVLLGDMNDTPAAAPLAAFAGFGMTDALADPAERGGAPRWGALGPPPTSAWTNRFVSGGHARYELMDQIWLSPTLAARLDGSFILRRRTRGRDGSDHDPAWIRLAL